MKDKNIFFIILVGISAILLAVVGSWFSVYGLTKIFPAGWLTFILFGSLEFAKLVVVSFVYRFWKITKMFQKIYLILATIVLMLITSMGIYGFLTNAYQKTATLDKLKTSEVEIYNMKKMRFSENRTYYMFEKKEIDNSISDLRKGLSNNVIQYTDSTGRLITTTSTSTRRALQEQLKDAVHRRDDISKKLEIVTDSLSYYDRIIFKIESENDTSEKLGPLKYLSELTETPMNKVVNWLTLLIIFVFDPLAIMLIVSLNQLLLSSGLDPFDGTKSQKKMKESQVPENERTNLKDEIEVIKKKTEVTKGVPIEVIKEVPIEVIKEVPIEVIKEVPIEVKPKTDDIVQVTSSVNKAHFIPNDK